MKRFDWKSVKDEIIALKLEKGLGSRRISKYLKEKYDADVSDSSVRVTLKRWGHGGNTFESKLSENNFTLPENWNYGWLKTKEASIFIKNKEGIVSFDEMREDFLKAMKKHSPDFKKIPRKKITDKHLLVIDIADLHIGKLAVDSETGDAYDTETAFNRAIEGVSGILQKASGFPIEKILFVIGNDVLHVDNANKTTTGGTPQDVSGKWFNNYKIARELYVGVIQALCEIADVHVVHNPSNHDFVTGFMLADSVYSWFRKHPNVTFDVSNAHRKYFKYGTNLIGTSHGDGSKLDTLPLIMANEAKHDWAETDWRYIYLHHIHHKKQFMTMSGKDYHGVNIEYLRSPSGTDSWHHKNGFCLAPKAIEGFIHHKDFGQIARLTHLFK